MSGVRHWPNDCRHNDLSVASAAHLADYHTHFVGQGLWRDSSVTPETLSLLFLLRFLLRLFGGFGLVTFFLAGFPGHIIPLILGRAQR